MAQGGRTVKGVVLDEKNTPIAGATITVVNSDVRVTAGADGTFTLVAPTYATEVEASAEAYISTRLVIDGSYMMFKLKVDKAYAAAKAKAEEEARIAAEKKAEAERLAAEKAAAAKAKAEEEARIAAEKKAKAERVAAEKAAAAKAKAEEDARIAAEKKAEAIKKKEQAREAYIEDVYSRSKGKFLSSAGINYLMSSITSSISGSNYIGVNYIGGYRFNNHIYAGIGLGVSMAMNSRNETTLAVGETSPLPQGKLLVPIYLYARANILNKRCTPVVALALGGNISTKQSIAFGATTHKYKTSSLMAEPQIGVNYLVNKDLAIYFTVGVNLNGAPCCTGSSITDDNRAYVTIERRLRCGLNFHVGVSF